MLWIATLVAGVFIALIIRLWFVIPGRTPHYASTLSSRLRRRQPCRTCIFLGSGGHTAEMLQLAQYLDPNKYTPRTYVMASSDALSASKVDPDESYYIPRARHVGQGWISVPWTALKALLVAFQIIFKTMPDLILCNGPGSCVPICVAAYIPKILGIHPIQIIYVESFARVKTLSLTGKLLYLFVDRFLVQWPELQERYSKAEYRGILV
ncbi:udp-n-acetylglucosamine transferase subunitalg14 homolog [Lichtheimia corymbifera JMRC:FSU:9682]|uniref:UDP-N-acetylglucosamine transferase subunit ALG14 n=1 Tax=Lichtheimia corymbifera JMRC:FSU:9682 TaxID=1263082 RepID=A0A068RN21_9FUNG|nr:udp-n-acetylglucosamine transferase subunitalg14 homolog [Lichtheimia corymbifera JMRC:FSU:9682]